MLFFIVGLVLFTISNSKGQDLRCNTTADYNWLQVNATDRYQRFIELENFTNNYIGNQGQASNRLINGTGLIIIPVVVHVLHHGELEGTGYNISMATIESQIDVLNEDFRRLNADAINTPSAFQSVASDFGIEFRLACIDPNGNATNGVIRKYTNIQSFSININTIRQDGTINDDIVGIKKEINGSTAWSTERYLNIWVCNMNLAGYSTWPADYSIYPEFDGVVIDKESFGRLGGTVSGYDKGRTLTHEIGHWLNLKHLWGDRSSPDYNLDCLTDDLVGDTPKQKKYHSNCPSFPELLLRCNTSDASTMFMNFMDFVNDQCYNLFTNGQKLRARALFALGGPRANMIDNYFKVRQVKDPIKCNGKVYSNPHCLPTTWTILSGPATLTAGPGPNEATITATGTGTVNIRATSGNYITEDNINVTFFSPPQIDFVSFTNDVGGEGYWCSSNFNNLFSVEPTLEAVSYEARLLNWPSLSLFRTNNFAQPGVDPFGYVPSGWYVFQLRATDECGTSEWYETEIEYVDCLNQGGGENFRIVASPNPTDGGLNVIIDKEKEVVKSLSKNEKILFQLYNLGTTSLVKQWTFDNSQSRRNLHVQGLKSGQYMLVVTKGKYRQSTQIIIK